MTIEESDLDEDNFEWSVYYFVGVDEGLDSRSIFGDDGGSG